MADLAGTRVGGGTTLANLHSYNPNASLGRIICYVWLQIVLSDSINTTFFHRCLGWGKKTGRNRIGLWTRHLSSELQ